jgi:hypothetical protein
VGWREIENVRRLPRGCGGSLGVHPVWDQMETALRGDCRLDTMGNSSRHLFHLADDRWPNQITGANSRCAGQLESAWDHDAVVAGASVAPAAVAQFWRYV